MGELPDRTHIGCSRLGRIPSNRHGPVGRFEIAAEPRRHANRLCDRRFDEESRTAQNLCCNGDGDADAAVGSMRRAAHRIQRRYDRPRVFRSATTHRATFDHERERRQIGTNRAFLDVRECVEHVVKQCPYRHPPAGICDTVFQLLRDAAVGRNLPVGQSPSGPTRSNECSVAMQGLQYRACGRIFTHNGTDPSAVIGSTFALSTAATLSLSPALDGT